MGLDRLIKFANITRQLIPWRTIKLNAYLERLGGLCRLFFWEKDIMRTAVYIDGYNLYYGAIHGTKHKWLDVVGLFTHLAQKVEPSSDVVKVRYFTSRVSGKYSKHGQDSYTSQDRYIRALEALYPSIFTKILGKHLVREDEKILFQETIDIKERVRILNIEEKKTDVNIALDMYRDAVSSNFDQLVLVTSDSDLQPAIHLIKQDYSKLKLGVILPTPPSTSEKSSKVRSSGALQKDVDWILNNIGEKDMFSNQLPNSIKPQKGQNIIKPSYW